MSDDRGVIGFESLKKRRRGVFRAVPVPAEFLRALAEAHDLRNYEDGKLIYAASTRNGFTPASRAELFKKLKPLEIKECPFANMARVLTALMTASLAAEKVSSSPCFAPELYVDTAVRTASDDH